MFENFYSSEIKLNLLWSSSLSLRSDGEGIININTCNWFFFFAML